MKRRVSAVILIAAVLAGIGIILVRSKPDSRAVSPPSARRAEELTIDTAQRQITFPAHIRRDTGKVLTMIYLEGYYWLKDYAALVSSVRLRNLQKAIAQLNPLLWDSIRLNLSAGERIGITLLGAESIPVRRALDQTSTPSFRACLFIGIPQLDNYVLSDEHDPVCATCPSRGEEMKAVNELARSSSGLTGVRIEPGVLPPAGTELKVVLQIP